jgi:hypothetical protein
MRSPILAFWWPLESVNSILQLDCRKALQVLRAGLGLLIGMTAITATAATFSVSCDGRTEKVTRGCAIKLVGKIEEGDAQRLLGVIKSRPAEGWHYASLLLDSPGGSISAALELASVVRRALLQTATYRRSSERVERFRCVSACFLVWVAGAERGAMGDFLDNPDLGLHRPFFEARAYQAAPEQVAELQQRAMLNASEYLKREQIPQQLIEKMQQRASTQVYWLTADETSDITGRAPWFEEMMIARCQWDPTYDSETVQWAIRSTSEALQRKRKSDVFEQPRYQQYLRWRQEYNSCEYQIRSQAQAALR